MEDDKSEVKRRLIHNGDTGKVYGGDKHHHDDEAEEHLDEDTRKIRKQNMSIMVSIMSFAMVSFSVFNGTYSQWIYVRFEEKALGANFSKLNESAAVDPCFRSNGSESPYRHQLEAAQSNAARFGVINMLCILIPSFFVNMVLGGYSDRLGRRFIFIVTLAGTIVRIGAVAAVAQWHLNLYIILIGAVINGCTGDMPALFTAIFLYTADNSTGKGRALAMVVAQTIIILCYNLAQLALGYYIEAVGYVWPLFTGFLMMICAFLICVFFLRETLDKSKANRNLSLGESIKGVFTFYLEKPENPKYKRYDFVILGLVFLALGSAMTSGVQTLFLMNEPLCWGSKKQGYALSISGVFAGIMSALVTALMKRCIRDEVACCVCLLSIAANNFFMSFAFTDWQIYLALGVGFMNAPSMPIIRAILSKMVRLEKRGSLFASVAVIEVATVAISNSGLNELYAATVTEWRGLTFFVVGCIISFALLIMVVYTIIVTARTYPLSIKSEDDDMSNGKRTVNSINSEGPEGNIQAI